MLSQFYTSVIYVRRNLYRLGSLGVLLSPLYVCHYRRHDIQHFETQHNDTQKKDIFVTLSTNDIKQKDTQHNKRAVVLSVATYLLLC